MATYATIADFEEYVEGWTTTNPDALERLLERAERDIDALLGPRPVDPDTGLKLDPPRLAAWERTALARATCAQAEYRFHAGETAWAGGTVAGGGGRVQGPDFSYDLPANGAAGAPGARVSPKVATELAPIAHLRVLTAAIR
jgi:hypothetical protein